MCRKPAHRPLWAVKTTRVIRMSAILAGCRQHRWGKGWQAESEQQDAAQQGAVLWTSAVACGAWRWLPTWYSVVAVHGLEGHRGHSHEAIRSHKRVF